MKKTAITVCFALISILGLTQDIDSFLSIPQTLELEISTPQPRLKEKFQVSLDINYIRAHIFKTTSEKLQLAEDFGGNRSDLMTLNVNAMKKGKNEIGPLQFTLNGTQYSTNKIEYEVIDALQNTDEGLWIRKAKTSDSTFCIIIEQRIPAVSRTSFVSEIKTKYWTEPVSDNGASFKFPSSIEGLKTGKQNSYSDFGAIYDDMGELKQFMSRYSIIYFTIVDRNKKIVITANEFDNLPSDYKFKDIVIR